MSMTRSARPMAAGGQQVAGERRQHALVALLVDQPMGGLAAVPVAGLLLVRRGPDLHSRQSTPSSTLEVKMSDRLLTIGELARRAGVATSALRYWEELGLLPAAARISGQRRYPESAVGLVGIILLLREVGFSLAEQKAFMASRAVALDDWQRLARRKLAELDDQIAKAQTARQAIDHALRCPHEDILQCPNFASVIAARLTGQPLQQAHPH
jgi:DNA-binding transcriptional MerR regulator